MGGGETGSTKGVIILYLCSLFQIWSHKKHRAHFIKEKNYIVSFQRMAV